jgi:CRP/FNR family transcriptional regulator, cyclic AMP receptor protein
MDPEIIVMQPDRSKTLSPALLAELAAHGEVRVFARNEQLISEGELSDSLYLLVSGELKVYTQDERGRELVYNVLHVGELFGELFLDGEVRSASVRAMTEAQCIVVDQVMAQGLIRSYPAFAEFLILKLIGRLRRATELCKRLGLSDVSARTIALLEQNAVVDTGIHMIPLSLTQQEIADRVGATREMINHVIGDLIRGGYLVRDDKRRLRIEKPLPRRMPQDN